MGRKKIEIRPLGDERNRNVTFLKRKAGLMKKAWELSVLCAADVSILIFSSNGKPFEFSSKDLDGEFERYLDYEGTIERRRAPEFAAMAAAGDDEDDEDDEGDRRGSMKGKQGGPAGPGKSLKGKESFKTRQPSRSDPSTMSKRRKRTREESAQRGFIDGLISTSDEEEDKPDIHDRADMSSMQYAMNLHQTPSYPPQSSARSQYEAYRGQSLQPSYANYNQSSYQQTAQQQYPSSYPPPATQSASAGFVPDNMQWDPEMLSRYAEYQLQQNHQRQQRILLERQRHQLAELGIPVDDSALLNQLFAGGVPLQQTSTQPQPSLPQPRGDDSDQGVFIWPTASGSGRQQSSRPPVDPVPVAVSNSLLDNLYSVDRDGAAKEGDEAGFTWPTGDSVYLPSPDSPEDPSAKKRGASPYFMTGVEDKRSRVY